MGNHKLLNDTSLRLCQSVRPLRARSMTRLDLFAAGMCSPLTSSHRATKTCRNTVFVFRFEWASRTRAMRLCMRASQNQYQPVSHVTLTARISEEKQFFLRKRHETQRSSAPATKRLTRQARTSPSQRLFKNNETPQALMQTRSNQQGF